MVRIREISKVKPGDIVNYKGQVSVVHSIEIKQDNYILKLENGKIIKERLQSKFDFFRSKIRY